jgi:cell wall-associated NlpC family hydrolase
LVEDEEGQSVAWAEAKHFKEVKTAPTAPPIVVAVVTGKAIVAKAMTQNGDPYIFGYETNLNNPNPSAFDCSELVEWDCHQLGVVPRMPDGAANQYDHCKRYGTVISVAEGVRTVGALLFRLTSDGNHVVISRGDGSTIEAKGRDYGVGVFSTAGRGFNAAALIPGVTYV